VANKRQGIWAEIQRERARQARARQQQFREFRRAEAQAAREAAKAERDRQRRAAVDERERKILYVEDRKAEAAAMAEDVRARLAELGGLLRAGIRDRPVITFADLRRAGAYPAFDAGPLGKPVPPPLWEHYAPQEPSGLGKLFGGAGRFERQLAIARAEYAQDDGVDAVAVNTNAVFGGMCIIQAKRWRSAVGVEAVRALAGVMEDKHATKGILVTTSWVTKDGHAFAARHGRIEIMECEHVKYLCKEHLGLDVLISLPKPPPR
jgi:hypothetical protein